LAGGMALYETAAKRDEPIPVFAEMGSVNPVVLLPEKLISETSELASSYAGSITLGVGQFCTNPGLLIAIKSEALEQFTSQLGAAISNIAPATMLNEGISKNYHKSKEIVLEQEGVELIGAAPTSDIKNGGNPTVALVSGKDFISRSKLQNEVFGPYSLIVSCENKVELLQVVNKLKGQLTATVMATDSDVEKYASVINQLSNVVGRLIFNGVPTGVEVTHAMQHGGPFPASTDGRFTSVGTGAIKRFVRPLAFQNAPHRFLPDELKDDNQLGIWRTVNGELKK